MRVIKDTIYVSPSIGIFKVETGKRLQIKQKTFIGIILYIRFLWNNIFKKQKIKGMETININKALIADLEKIIHIGPVRALEIVKHRPFRDIHELSNVPGLGKIRMQQILQQGIASV